ncbi:hypothetical protein SH449x_004472 [Pirellulaceae bacterium SH449]
MMQRSPLRESILVACLILLAFASAFPIVMSTLAPYDDQGYVMMTVKTFLAGETLYGKTHTQYGPAYYLLTGSLHSVMGIPLTQDGVRVKTVIFWCLSTLLAYSILRRLGWGVPITLFFATLFHLHLSKLALEPGHPQEWILVLSLLSFWYVVGTNRYRWLLAAIAVGLIGMIKINCGFLFAVPLIIQALVAYKQDSAQRSAMYQVLAGGAGATVAVFVLSLGMGITAEQFLWGLVGQHRGFANDFYHLIPVSAPAILFGFCCLAAFVWKNTNHGGRKNKESAFGNTTLCFLVLSAVAVAAYQAVSDWWSPLIHGLEPRGASTWLVIIGPAMSIWLLRSDETARSLSPYVIGVTWLAPLMAYPTPGTQLTLGTSFGWIVFGVLASFCCRSLATYASPRNLVADQTKLRFEAGNVRLLPLMSISLGIMVSIVGWQRWLSYSPIGLRGSEWLRLDPVTCEQELQIARAIARTGCERLVFDGHNHNRFYFWTDTKPLTAANPTFWPRMLTFEEQQRIQSILQEDTSICMVIPPESDALSSERTGAVRASYYEGWEETERVGDWRVGVRRPTSSITD